MKKQVISEERACDICGKWCYDGCLGCGVDHCHDHKKELGVEYGYSATYGGACADGYFCHKCDKKLRASGNDPLHVAYLEVKALGEEWAAVRKDVVGRDKMLSSRIQVLYDKRRENA